MARGWESKAVESQIEARSNRDERIRSHQVQAAEISLQRERESLQLSRTRVLQDLESSQNPRYQEVLRKSLQFLDEKIAALEASASEKKAIQHHA